MINLIQYIYFIDVTKKMIKYPLVIVWREKSEKIKIYPGIAELYFHSLLKMDKEETILQSGP